MIIKKELVVSNKKKSVIEDELRGLKFKAFPKNNKKAIAVAGETEDALDDEDAETGQAGDFDYLLGMAIWSLTAEKVSMIAMIDEKGADQFT
jgi:DNA topoisomerase-2